MKTLVDENRDFILEFTTLGADAGELIAAVQVVMLAAQPYTLLRDAVFTHPTMSEGLKTLFAGVPRQAPEKREYARSAGQKQDELSPRPGRISRCPAVLFQGGTMLADGRRGSLPSATPERGEYPAAIRREIMVHI